MGMRLDKCYMYTAYWAYVTTGNHNNHLESQTVAKQLRLAVSEAKQTSHQQLASRSFNDTALEHKHITSSVDEK